jgi:hypothetical protein
VGEPENGSKWGYTPQISGHFNGESDSIDHWIIYGVFYVQSSPVRLILSFSPAVTMCILDGLKPPETV